MNFTRLDEYLDSLREKYGIPGCDLIVARDGEQIYRRGAGFSDYAGTRPVSEEDFYYCYSTTKPVTMTAALRLVEEGRLRLDDEVSAYLPEFGSLQVRGESGVHPLRGRLTIRRLMTMTGGLDYNVDSEAIRAVLRETGGQATTRQLMPAIAAEPLSFEPGRSYQYSLGHDVIAAVIEVVTGMTFGAYVQKTIFGPLGMRASGFRLTPEIRAHMAAQYMYDTERGRAEPMPLTNVYILSERYESGGAGLISKPGDYIRFASALANGGTAADGYRLLSRESIDWMRRPMLTPECLAAYDKWPQGYSYGLGVRTLTDKSAAGARSPVGEFGWDGAAGAYALMDPQNRLALYYIQHCRKCLVAFDFIHPAIRDLVYDCLGL